MANTSPQKVDLKKGKLLLAEPFMMDPNFKRSVVLLCEHEKDEGTIGFILNKKLDVNLNDIMADFPEFDSPVFLGGPVQTNTIHYLHNVGDLLEGSQPIIPGVFWGGDFEKLKFLISSELVKPQNIRFFVGYSGWSEGQLVDEMEYGSWVLGDMDANYLFRIKPSKLWKEVMEGKGDKFSVIAQMPEFSNWN